MKISRLFCVMGMIFLATVMGANAATVILVTVSNSPPAVEGEPILITGSAMYSDPYYPASGSTTTITLGGQTSNTHTFAGGAYSASMGPLPAGEYTACVHITDTSVEGSNCLAITVLAVKSNQSITFPAIAGQLTTATVGLTATASSGLPVSFTVGSGPASIAGGTNLTFSGTGGVSIVASQAGNASWNPAPNVTNTFVTSTALPLEITSTSLPNGLDGIPYSASLAAANGVPPYSWSVQPISPVVAWGENQDGQCTVPTGLTSVVMLAAGNQHSLALMSNETVVAWGDNPAGQCDVPTNLTGVVMLAGGNQHSLALKSDGAVVAWGNNWAGQCDVPTNLTGVVAIAGGNNHNLALKSDGSMVAWGYNSDDQCNVPAGLNDVVAITAGYGHCLALRSNGTVVAWGNNWYGQTNVPVGLSNVVKIAAGYYHNVALKSDGSIVAWGNNVYGQSVVPTGLTSVVAIGAGNSLSLALKNNGTVVAWGRNDEGQCNVPTNLTGVVAIAGGGLHSLALRSSCSPFPEGLSCSTGGVVSGIPTQAGSNQITFVVRDSVSETTNKTLELVIREALPSTIIVTMSNTPPVYAGSPILISGSARYSDPDFPVQGATVTLTLGGVTHSLYTLSTGNYSTNLEPLAAGVYTASVHVTDYSVSGTNSLVITVLGTNQTITFPAIADPLTTDTVELAATASSGLPVSFAVASGPASIAGGTNLTFSDAGSVSIVASQAGDGSWNPAPDVTNTFMVTAVPSNQTITFPSIGNKFATDAVGLAATASSGLPVSFAVGAGPASIASGTNLTFSGTGSVSIVASQAGDGSWNPAPNVTNTFTVTAPTLPLEITTASLPSGLTGSPYSATLVATNGAPPYTWSSGTLPLGLSCSSNGLISGTPTQAGTNLVTVTVQDSLTSTTNQSLGIVVQADTNVVALSTALYDRGQPLVTYVVGDVLDFQYEFAINTNTTGWSADYGLGQSTDGTDWSWYGAGWSRMDGVNNRVWIASLHEHQFTSAGTWYYAGRFFPEAPPFYNVATDWAPNSGEPLAAESYFTVNELAVPGDVIAEPNPEYSATRAQLACLQSQQKGVLATISSNPPTGSPEQNVQYMFDDTIGNQRVVGTGGDWFFAEVQGLMPGQTYYFTFYAENMLYYSEGWTQSCTMAYPQARNTDGGAPEAPTEVFLGDSGLTFGCDVWGTLEGQSGRARMWMSLQPDPKFDGTSGEWSNFTDAEHKTCASPWMFEQTGMWSWGIQVDYGSPYGDDFWYLSDNTWWQDMDPMLYGACPTVTVLPINDPTNPTAAAGGGDPLHTIDLSWSKNAQGHDVMVMRKPAAGSWMDVEYMQGMPFEIGMTFGDATVADKGPFTGGVASGLDPGTTYDFKIYSVNNDMYYSSGVEVQASTDANPLEILTTSLPDGMVGVPYNASLEAINGMPPYTWYGDLLPDGLSCSMEGVLSGTPTQDGTYQASLMVSDGSAIFADKTLEIVIQAAPEAPAAPVAGAATDVATTSFSANWAASATATNYFLDVATDALFSNLVAGLDNLPTGDVLNWPVTGLSPGQTVYYRVRAQNDIQTSENSEAITVQTDALPPFEITTASLPSGIKDEVYSAMLAATNGMPPYAWTSPSAFCDAWGCNDFGQSTVPPGLSNVVAMAGGGTHSIALKSDGTLVAWGEYANQILMHRPGVPDGLNSVIAIAAGADHNLALQSNGSVTSWGWNLYDQTNVPGTAINIIAVAGGHSHSLALKSSGTVLAWGRNNAGQIDVPVGLDSVVAIASFNDHNLALKSNGTVVAWGANTYGQLDVPAGLNQVVKIVAGANHSLALKSDGTMVAWGRNDHGQTNVPTGLSQVVAIAAGESHCLALRSDGTVVGWGNDTDGRATLPAEVGPVTSIAAGWYHSLAICPSNAPLPPGLALSTDGVISGTPTQAGTNVVLFVVRDSIDTMTNRSLEIVIQAAPPEPLAPVANAATAVLETSFSANWEASATATNYFLDVATDASFSNLVAGFDNLPVGNVLTESVTGLPEGQTVYYRVRAQNRGGASENSGPITVQLLLYTGDRYVSPAGDNTPPYSSWVTAAHSIQDAVDAASVGTHVWVSNGVYASGMHEMTGVVTSNRVVIDKAIRVESLNGPEFTLIEGNGESDPHLRCVYLAAGATLSGFTIQNGYADVLIESTTTNGEGILIYTFVDGIETNCGGGVLAEDLTAVVSNCLFIGNRAIGDGGAFYGGSGFNCTFLSNSAITFDGSSSLDDATTKGGAARYAALSDCTAMWNSCSHGGAFADGTAVNCTLVSNSATYIGGGALDTEAEDCEFSWNYAQTGGGLHGGSALRCTFTANGAGWGAGAANAGLSYCRLSENSAFHSGGGSHSGGSTGCVYTANYSVNGGGAWAGIHTHSTFTKNTAEGGILRSAWAYNCLVWDNNSLNPAAYDNGEVRTSEAFEGGWKQPWRGTTLYAPGLSTSWRLATNALSIGAGSSAYSIPVDIDGQPYRSPPTPGADEPYSSNGTGILSVAIHPVSTPILSEIEISLTAEIDGAATGNEWDMGDGTILTNQLVAHHSWQSAGTYPVTLRAWNLDEPGGIIATASVIVTACPVYYVSPTGQHTYPYNTWEKAATNIQAAINVAPSNGGATVWVSDGVYNTGSQPFFYNDSIDSSPTRVVIDKPIRVYSVNGPDVTIIEGQGPVGVDGVRCVYITRDAILDGFTLTQGHTHTEGSFVAGRQAGGAFGEFGSTIRNCVIVSNAADLNPAGILHSDLHDCIIRDNQGMGAHECTLADSILMNNSGGAFGGGAMYGYYIRCSFISNTATTGGGASRGYALNCVFEGNEAFGQGGALNKSYAANCTFIGNHATNAGALMESTAVNSIFYGNDEPELKWSNTSDCFFGDPSFVNTAAKNYSLLPESPCINTGTFVYLVSGPLDRRGNSRLQDESLDLGAYEFQGTVLTDADGDGMSDDWELAMGLSPEIPNNPAANADGDSLTDWQEYIAMTEPTNPESVFDPPTAAEVSPEGDRLQIGSTSTNRIYDVKYIVDLLVNPQVWISCGYSRPGNGDVLEFELTNGLPHAIYRIGVSLP